MTNYPQGGYEAAPPQSTPPNPQYQNYAPNQGYQTGQPSAPSGPVTPKKNPLAGIPVADYIRDALAALFLLVSLALTWQGILEGKATDRIEVILITVLSVLSIGIPYLARLGVFPATWTVREVRNLKLAANAPYVILVLVYIVIDIIKYEDGKGIGSAAALGLVGAIIAASPRQAELGPADQDQEPAVIWKKIVLGTGGFVAFGFASSLVLFFVQLIDSSGLEAIPVILAFVKFAFTAAFALYLVYQIAIKQSEAWRIFGVALSIVIIVLFVFGAGDESTLPKLTGVGFVALDSFLGGVIAAPLSLIGGVGAFFIPAFVAAASSPALLRGVGPAKSDINTWFEVIKATLLYVSLIAGAVAINSLLALFISGDKIYGDKPTAVWITSAILGAAIVAAVLYAYQAFTRNAVQGRVIVLVALGLTFVLGLVILIIAPSINDQKFLTAGHLILAFGLPIIGAYAFFAPKAVREYFTHNRPAVQNVNPAAYQWNAAQNNQPVAPPSGQFASPVAGPGPVTAPTAPVTPVTPVEAQVPGQPQEPAQLQGQPQETAPVVENTPSAPTHGYTAQQASDASTPAAILAQIAQEAPELRVNLAQNPATYPALLEWLGNLNDPQINEALRNRK